MIDHIDGAAEFKFDSQDALTRGEFVGYASTFGNVDLGGDIVERGAFAQTLAAKKLKDIKMFFGHDARSVPVGKWIDLKEDDRGLVARGQLTLDIPKARDIHAAMKDGTLDGLSIGYRIPPGGAEADRGGRFRRLKAIDLFEVSIVPQPMNTRATVQRLKSLDEMSADDIREIEATLRTKGLSQRDAVKAVAGFKEWLRRDAGAPETGSRDEGAAAELADIIRRNTQILSR